LKETAHVVVKVYSTCVSNVYMFYHCHYHSDIKVKIVRIWMCRI